MSYAENRKIIDADSHVIELDDFLHLAASEADKSLIPNGFTKPVACSSSWT